MPFRPPPMPLQLSCNSRCFLPRSILRSHSNIHMKLLKTEKLRHMVYKNYFAFRYLALGDTYLFMLCVISSGFFACLFEAEVLLEEQNSAQVSTFGNLVTNLQNTTFDAYKKPQTWRGWKGETQPITECYPLERRSSIQRLVFTCWRVFWLFVFFF